MGKTIEGAYDAHRRTTKDKVHRRNVPLGSRAFSVLSLRPGTRHRFAMNRFHETWHVLCDAGSAHYLARLLWALSFQKQTNTVLVIDGESIVPNPFDGDDSPAFVFANQATTALNRRQSEQLARQLPVHGGHRSRRSEGTVVMHSHGRPKAVADYKLRTATPSYDAEAGSIWTTKKVVFFVLPPTTLRHLSLQADRLDDMERPTDAIFFGPHSQHHCWYPEGEIQTLTNFGPRVDDVRHRRKQLVGDRKALSWDERCDLWWGAPSRPSRPATTEG
jgi:hypothetical protein